MRTNLCLDQITVNALKSIAKQCKCKSVAVINPYDYTVLAVVDDYGKVMDWRNEKTPPKYSPEYDEYYKETFETDEYMDKIVLEFDRIKFSPYPPFELRDFYRSQPQAQKNKMEKLYEEEFKLFNEIRDSIDHFIKGHHYYYLDVREWLEWESRKEFPIIVQRESPEDPILVQNREKPFSIEFIDALERLFREKFKCDDMDVITPIPRWAEEVLNRAEGTETSEKWCHFYLTRWGEVFIERPFKTNYCLEEAIVKSYSRAILKNMNDPIEFIKEYKEHLYPGDYEDIMSYETTEEKVRAFIAKIIR